MSDVAVLMNPTSGPAYRRQSVRDIEAWFAANGLRAHVAVLDSHQRTTELARQAVREGCPTVVAAGGDGTVGAVAAALVNTEASLGVLPLGTLNHFARDLRLPFDVKAAIAAIARGKTAQLDAGEVNGRVFVNNSSIGIYPNIVILRERGRRLGQGKWIAFARATLAVLRRFPFWTVRVHVDGRSMRQKTPFVFVGNNEYRSQGLEIGRRERIDSGHLFLYVAARTGRLGFIWMALSALFGHLDKTRSLEMMCADEAWVETRHKHIRVSADGEVSRMRGPLHYRVLPKALKVIVV